MLVSNLALNLIKKKREGRIDVISNRRLTEGVVDSHSDTCRLR